MNRFRELRKSRGITQEDFGKILNVQKATISRYEKGVIFPSPDVLKKMANYFNVSIDYLLGNEGKSTPPITPEEKTLLVGFKNLTNEGRNTLLAVLSSLQITHAVLRV